MVRATPIRTCSAADARETRAKGASQRRSARRKQTSTSPGARRAATCGDLLHPLDLLTPASPHPCAFHPRCVIFFVTSGTKFVIPCFLARLHPRCGNQVAELRELDRQMVHHEPKRGQRVVDRACDGRRGAEVA